MIVFKNELDIPELKNKYQYPAIAEFNRQWEARKWRTPVVILLGGYAGVGKSTLSECLAKHVVRVSSYATGFARAAAQNFYSIDENKPLHSSTFKLHELNGGVVDENLANLFKMQRDPITNILLNCTHFIASEHQNTIIDGNHVSPDLSAAIERDNPAIIPVEVYLKVSDPNTHYKMLCGPTHNRTLDTKEFDTARYLHDYLVWEAEAAGKSVFEYDVASEETLKIVNSTLEQALNSS